MFSDPTRLPPSVFVRPTTGYRLTVLPTICRLNNDKTRPSDRAVVACLSPDHLLISYYLADAALSASSSSIRPPVCSPGSCSAVCRPSTGRPRCPHRPSTARRPFASTRSFLRFPLRCSCYRLFVVPTVSR